jgi:hypothetical protein
MAMRLPLLDPDKLLDATLPLVRPLFSIFGRFAAPASAARLHQCVPGGVGKLSPVPICPGTIS